MRYALIVKDGEYYEVLYSETGLPWDDDSSTLTRRFDSYSAAAETLTAWMISGQLPT